MATDQTNKALNMGSKTVSAVRKLMDAIEELQSIDAERSAAGVDLTAHNAAFAESDIKHVDGASLNAVLNTSIPAIWTYMASNSHDDNLQKVR